MYKSKMTTKISKLMNLLHRRKKEIRFVLLALLLATSSYLATEMYFFASDKPLFANPTSTLQTVLNIPIMFAIATGFGSFGIAYVVLALLTMNGTKKFSVGSASIELTDSEKKQLKAEYQFGFLSALTKNYYVLLEKVFDKGEVTKQTLIKEMIAEYVTFVNESNGEILVEAEIKSVDDMNRQEKSLKRFLESQSLSVGYKNRMVGKENYLVGQFEEDGIVFYITLAGESKYEFDEYDREVTESLINLSVIILELFDELIND